MPKARESRLSELRAVIDDVQNCLSKTYECLNQALEAEAALLGQEENPPRPMESQGELIRATLDSARQTRQSALNMSSHVGKAIVLATKYLQAQETALRAPAQTPSQS